MTRWYFITSNLQGVYFNSFFYVIEYDIDHSGGTFYPYPDDVIRLVQDMIILNTRKLYYNIGMNREQVCKGRLLTLTSPGTQ